MAKILVDTNILSIAYLPQAPDWIWDWLESLPRGAIALPWVAVYETEYGIRTAQRDNPAKALELLVWFEEFLRSNVVFPEMDIVAARLLGQMAATPGMSHFFVTTERKNKAGQTLKMSKIKLGCDPMLAALAISHQLPIATFNLRDFMYINRYFPLPGIYSPEADAWILEPPVGWGLDSGANDDLPSERRPGWARGPKYKGRGPSI